jgi:PKD domain
MRRAFVLALAVLLPALAAPAADAARTPPAIEGAWSAKFDVVDATGRARPHEGKSTQSALPVFTCSGPCAARLRFDLPGRVQADVRHQRGRLGIYKATRRGKLRCASGRRVDAQVISRFKVTHAVRRAGRRLADQMSGTVRLSGTCGGRASTLSVSWAATRSDIPEAPTAGFTLGPDPVSLTADGGVVSFTDTSVDDIDGGTIVSRVWEFGDPASGDANVAEGTLASHRYTTIGTFTVRLTVTDDDGLSTSVADVVSVEP